MIEALLIMWATCMGLNSGLIWIAHSVGGLEEAFEKAKRETPADKLDTIPSPALFSTIFVLLGPITLAIALLGGHK